MVDKTSRRPLGIIRHVVIKIDIFLFPVDFMVLVIEEYPNILFVLGRTFIKTARMLLEINKWKVKVMI